MFHSSRKIHKSYKLYLIRFQGVVLKNNHLIAFFVYINVQHPVQTL